MNSDEIHPVQHPNLIDTNINNQLEHQKTSKMKRDSSNNHKNKSSLHKDKKEDEDNKEPDSHITDETGHLPSDGVIA